MSLAAIISFATFLSLTIAAGSGLSLCVNAALSGERALEGSDRPSA